MATVAEVLSRWPRLFRVVAMPHRYRRARGYYKRTFPLIRRWVLRSRETSNFTYDLEPLNLTYLACFVAAITAKTIDEIVGYLAEIDDDRDLKSHIARWISEDPQYRMRADLDVRFGRRAGWYAFVRAMKPEVVIETGVDKGMGSVVLASAILRNRSEGHPGKYYGTDINPAAGYLFKPPYNAAGQILYGDSCESLQRLTEKVDLFINDSDHSAEYEAREYDVIAPKLSPQAIMLGDNGHISDALCQFARTTGRQFLFFQERPRDHWYPGAGIGVAYPK